MLSRVSAVRQTEGASPIFFIACVAPWGQKAVLADRSGGPGPSCSLDLIGLLDHQRGHWDAASYQAGGYRATPIHMVNRSGIKQLKLLGATGSLSPSTNREEVPGVKHLLTLSHHPLSSLGDRPC